MPLNPEHIKHNTPINPHEAHVYQGEKETVTTNNITSLTEKLKEAQNYIPSKHKLPTSSLQQEEPSNKRRKIK